MCGDPAQTGTDGESDIVNSGRSHLHAQAQLLALRTVIEIRDSSITTLASEVITVASSDEARTTRQI
jgi:hypothetical protein